MDDDNDGFITVRVLQDKDALPNYVAPNIRDAKTYRYSHFPHRVKAENQRTGYRLARPGELTGTDGQPAELYSMFDNSEVLDEFGIGIGLYFKTVKFLFLIFLACALISLVAITENEKSNPDADDAAAFERVFNSTIDETSSTLYGSTYGATRDSLKYNKQAAADIVCVLILTIALVLASLFAEKDVVEAIDAAQQTTQDYSVVIDNPAVHITDPKVYFDHFSTFGEVVLVTIANNNGDLLEALAKKRVLNSQLERKMQFPDEEKQSGLDPVEVLTEKIATLQSKVDGLTSKDYVPWKVFITYNTELAQRTCLERTSTGMWARYSGYGIPNDAIVGSVPVSIRESPEPTDIIYANSHLSVYRRYFLWLVSQSICGVMLLAAYFIIEALSKEGEVAAAIFISLCNAAMPITLKMITIKIEAHNTQTSMQQSMLFKLVFARCLVAAVLFYIATPFSESFSDSRLQQIQNILIADALTAPLIRLCDFHGYFMRYVYGPRVSVTQEELNIYWQGTDLTLAERYTDILKTCFVGLFFAVPLPSGLFITAFAMVSTYLVDKFSLFRIWRRQAMYNASMGKFSRYFLVLCVWVHLQISRVYFANWPYGGLDGKDPRDQEAVCGFFVCKTNSDMTDAQEGIVSFYTGASVAGFCVCVSYLILFRIFSFVKRRVLSSAVSTHSDVSTVTFRALSGPSGYIPLIRKHELLHPVLCCDIQKLPTTILPLDISRNENLIARSVSVCNTNEFSVGARVEEESLKGLFGSCVYYTDPGFTAAPPTSSEPMGKKQSSHVADVLPVGWETETSDTGRVYYIDHNTKTTHWTLPVMTYAQQVLPPRKDHSNQFKSPAITPSIEPGIQRQLSTDAPLNELPYGWEQRKVVDSEKVYYVNHLTKVTQWHHPSTDP